MRWSLCFAILVGMSQSVTIVGAGLAGSEAALQLEMRPKTPTLVHVTGCCAELVCSNSLKSEKPDSAAGMLKRELAELGSQLYAQAKLHAVPAGGALAVDRTAFAEAVTALVEAHPLIDLVHEEVVDLVQAAEGADALVVAAGPLASDALAASLSRLAGEEHLAFYDAAAPIVMADSLDYAKLFRQSRYEDAADAGDYLNAPFSREEYDAFVDELVAAERVIRRDFDARLVPGVPADRGDRPQGTRRASLRHAQAGGAHRPAHGASPMGRAAAACRGRARFQLQPRGVPDEPHLP